MVDRHPRHSSRGGTHCRAGRRGVRSQRGADRSSEPPATASAWQPARTSWTASATSRGSALTWPSPAAWRYTYPKGRRLSDPLRADERSTVPGAGAGPPEGDVWSQWGW